MRLELTDQPDADDEAFVIDQTRAYNRRFVQGGAERLCVFARNDEISAKRSEQRGSAIRRPW
jgi:predicted nucleotidyltransferase